MDGKNYKEEINIILDNINDNNLLRRLYTFTKRMYELSVITEEPGLENMGPMASK